MQVLLVRKAGSAPPESKEAVDGVTAPMANARARHFRRLPTVEPHVVQRVEAELLAILRGDAPEGWEFHDVEEVRSGITA